jgi:alkylation response protein AidB-like acyl-CoA dehydrogenase
VPRIAAGELRLAFAHGERQARNTISDVATASRKAGAGWILDGQKSLVLGGDSAEMFVVSARSAGTPRARGGLSLFLVDAAAPGLTRRGYATQDGLRAAEVSLAGVPAELVGTAGAAIEVIERVVDEAIAALCAEAVGVMTVMHETTLDYLKQRKQFGRAIGEFQVLQHRAVDMFVALEQARSMAMFATVMTTETDARERRRAMAAAKVQIGRSGRLIGEEAVQLHGGIGMTMEYTLGHYFKRMTMIDLMFGDADFHLAQLAGLGGLFAPEQAA